MNSNYKVLKLKVYGNYLFETKAQTVKFKLLIKIKVKTTLLHSLNIRYRAH